MVPVTHAPTQQIEAPLDETQCRRALGAVVGAAAGDALGAPYEFQRAIARTDDVEMMGGGILGWEPGEWTDDTAMSYTVLEAVANAAPGCGLLDEAVLDDIAAGWYRWSLAAPDIGALTSTVIGRAAAAAQESRRAVPTAADFRAAAQSAHDDLPLVAGNGALLRVHTAAVATLRCDEATVERAILALSGLTHVHPDVRDACLLWGFTVRRAILTGQVDVRASLRYLAPSSQGLWADRIDEAEQEPPWAFARNGWVVGALQGAWSAVHAQLPLPRDKFAARDALAAGLEAAVRAGNDTDTVASIAGALLGAALGPKAVPTEWRRMLHGWPEAELTDLSGHVERLLARP